MNNNSIGEIITFYSYKGGTGRSMALANVACLLAQIQEADKDILMVDWDLEAPGLHQFFHGRFENNRDEQGDLPSGQLGLIDLFYEIRNRLEKNESQDSISEDIFSEIDIQKYIVKVNHLSLFLMPAGKFDDGLYSARVNEFDWADFFSHFPLLITQFAQHLREKFKYVLIDSRTGYTDVSGICTSILPEKLVTVFTPNRQSVSGIVELIRRATDYRKQSDDLRPLMIFPLPSRIENAEGDLKKEWRFGNSKHQGYQTQLESVLGDVYSLQECDLTNYFDEYQLQYVPRYSYGEELAVLSERSEERLSLARSFENFAEKIISSETPWEETKKIPYLSESEREKNKTVFQQVTVNEKAATAKPIPQRWRFWIIGVLSLLLVAGAIIISAVQIFGSAIQNQFQTQVALASSETSKAPNVVATSTVTLTNTPQPTSTPIGSDILPIKRIVRSENFDRLPLAEFELSGNYDPLDGVLRFTEPLVSAGSDAWKDGAGSLTSNFSVNQGNGYILLFRTTKVGTEFLVTFETGTAFNGPDYRAFWFGSYLGGQYVSIWKQNEFYSKTLDTQIQQDTWYYLFMRPYGNNVEIRLWEKDHPEKLFEFYAETQTEWANNNLVFHVGLPQGVMEIDEFQEVEFTADTLLALPTATPVK